MPADTTLIAFCGLYCGECVRYKKDKCPGCAANEQAEWCSIRKCCIKNGLSSCAECTTYGNVMDCSLFNNIMSKLFGFIFRSNRKACISFIKTNGAKAYAAMMTEKGQHTIKR